MGNDGGPSASGGAPASTGGASASTGGAPASTGGAPASSGGTGGATDAGSGGLAGGAGKGGQGAVGGATDSGGRSATGGTTSAGGMSGGAGGTTGSAWNSVFPRFTKHTIASFPSGYAHAIADVDHDGKPDVIALSSASGGVAWFKNPTWTKYMITTKASKLIFLAPYDVDGDGDMDVAVASDFSMTDTMNGGTISWAEAPSDPRRTKSGPCTRSTRFPPPTGCAGPTWTATGGRN